MEQATVTTNRRLERGNGPLGGVAAGMADYFNIDPTIVRLGLVATTLLGGPTIPIAYLAAWIIIPEGGDGSPSTPVAPAPEWGEMPPPPAPAPPVPVPPAPAQPAVDPFPAAESVSTATDSGSDAESGSSAETNTGADTVANAETNTDTDTDTNTDTDTDDGVDADPSEEDRS